MKMIYMLIIAIFLISAIRCMAETKEEFYNPKTKSPNILITGDWQITIGGEYNVAGE